MPVATATRGKPQRRRDDGHGEHKDTTPCSCNNRLGDRAILHGVHNAILVVSSQLSQHDNHLDVIHLLEAEDVIDEG